MRARLHIRPEPEPIAGGLITFRREILAFLSMLLFFYSSVTALGWKGLGPRNVEGITLTFAGLILAVIVFVLHDKWPTTASAILIIGLLVYVSRLVALFETTQPLALYAIPVLASTLLLGKAASLITGAGVFALMAWLYPARLGDQNLSMAAFVLIGMAGIAYITLHAVQLSNHWELSLFRIERDLVEQLRDRQGELNRTLKALDEAYAILKRTNQELLVARREAEESRASKEQFVANVSHELRTPLNLILGFAEMMYLYPETYKGVHWTADLDGDIQELYRASRHLQSLVNDILDLSRIDASRLPIFRELHDVRMVINDALQTIAPLLRHKGLEYAAKLQEAPQVLIDPTRIRQVMLNLLSNAIRYTDRGSITIELEACEDSLVVSVQDTGVGIPQDQHAHVFEKFGQVDGSRNSRGGAGIGLALSRQFVELHGGRMWFESEMNKGSTFYFSLPLPGAKPHTVPLHRLPDLREADLSHAPIVVVDTDPSIAEMLQRYLGDRPVLAADTPAEAEQLIEDTHPIAIVVNQLPDAPLASWIEPTGENAWCYGVPIIRCAIPSPSWLPQTSGLDDCLAKPVDRNSLARVVDKRLSRPGTILVVDDDPGFVTLMGRLLRDLPKVERILSAYRGEQALQLARTTHPDLIFLDLAMPEMDGFAVVRAIRSDPDLARTQLVAVTATSYAEEVLMQRGTCLTVTQSKGIPSSAVVEMVRSVAGVIRPDYVVDDNVSDSA